MPGCKKTNVVIWEVVKTTTCHGWVKSCFIGLERGHAVLFPKTGYIGCFFRTSAMNCSRTLCLPSVLKWVLTS